MTLLRAGSATDVGRVRSINQDRLLVADGLFAVADGMGGHVGGEVAARLAVEALQESFRPDAGDEPLLGAIREANRAVWERSLADASLRGMGTTLTAVALVEIDGEERLVVANVGDSRAYLLQSGELSQLTADHSLVEEMVRAGELSEAEAVGHPHRHILTRALGNEPRVDIDSWQIIPHTGDRLLLCSDGLVNEVSDDDIAGILRSESDPDAAADKLVELARAHGGADNITAVVVDVVEGEPAPARPPGEAATSSDGTAAGARDSAAAASSGGAAAGARDGAPPEAGDADGAGDPPTSVTASAVASPPRPRPVAATTDAPRRPRRRRVTFRVVLFVLALLAVLGGAIAATVWYARSSYYVGLQGPRITIFQGRPGGVLWFGPTVARRTAYTTAQVLPSRIPDLKAGQLESSLGDAQHYVHNLVNEAAQAMATTSTTGPAQPPVGSTTTSAPPGGAAR